MSRFTGHTEGMVNVLPGGVCVFRCVVVYQCFSSRVREHDARGFAVTPELQRCHVTLACEERLVELDQF